MAEVPVLPVIPTMPVIPGAVRSVCMLSAPPQGSHGWGQYTRSLATALVRAGVRVTLITGVDAPPEPDLPIERADYHPILPSILVPKRFSSARLLAAARRVRALAASADVDVIHVAAEPYALACFGVDRPLVITAHGTYAPLMLGKLIVGRVARSIFARSHIICVSSYTARLLAPALPGPVSAHVRVIPNGVDVSALREPGAPVAKRGPTVVCVGQLKPRKGYHILAKAMIEVRRAIPDAQAVFIGDDSQAEYVGALRAQIASDHLSDAIRITGRISDPIKRGWLQSAEVFAMPALNTEGKFEGFGLVYLEASAVGLPVIGSLDCGAEDAIEDGVTGFLLPQDDAAALSSCIIRLLRDAPLRQRMGAAGWAFAEENTWDHVAQRVLRVYEAARR